MGKQKSNLLASELCSIIEACGKASVSELKFGDICVRFYPQSEPTLAPGLRIPSQGIPVNADESLAPTPEAEISEIQDKQAEISQTQMEVDMRRARLDQLFIENPTLAEHMLANGELEEDDGPDTDEDEA